ncbi:hypothetical protein HQ35_06425 [Porphyromonas cangingivalis]|uniref:Uncharacterized protein n=1 Tax=Porphyromonas cangingivalis TaxID=36874 RepID=A0A0A2ERL5_PORCN|nr:hypothetical protein HQ35_06425 [Porphyromonas cangingivalis]
MTQPVLLLDDCVRGQSLIDIFEDGRCLQVEAKKSPRIFQIKLYDFRHRIIRIDLEDPWTFFVGFHSSMQTRGLGVS